MEEITIERLHELLRERKGTHASAFPIGVPDALLAYLLRCEAMVRPADLLAEPAAPEWLRHRRPLSFGLCNAERVDLSEGATVIVTHDDPFPARPACGDARTDGRTLLDGSKAETLALHGIVVVDPPADGEGS